MQPFTGLVAYPITPLTDGGGLDTGTVAQLVGNGVAAGVAGVAVLASSGAGTTFNRRERHAVVAAAVAAAGATPVYAAVTAAGTREVLELARDAAREGAAGLVLTPFSYLPLSDLEVRGLFARLSDATELPLCFYNKPLQTQYDVPPATLAWLAAHTRVVAVKDSLRRDNMAQRMRAVREAVGPDFALGLSSDVHLLGGLDGLPAADAWHTGLAALLPQEYLAVWQAAPAQPPQLELPHSSRELLLRLAQAVAATPHGIGALHALARELGVSTAMPRGPLGAPDVQEVQRLRQALGRPGERARG